MTVKTFILQAPGANFIKLFMAMIYEFLKEARVFVLGKLFQDSLILQVRSKPTIEWSTLGTNTLAYNENS
jgi:hypothetical protein